MCNDLEISGATVVKYRGSASTLTLPEGITHIRAHAFEGCETLETLHLPATLRLVGEFAFNNCTALKNVYTPSVDAWLSIDFQGFCASPTSNGATLFVGNKKLTCLHVSPNTSRIGAHAFEGCTSLEHVVLNEHIMCIEKLAFSACTALWRVEIPSEYTSESGLQSIGYGAFRGCTALVSFPFPALLRSIASWAFAHCNALTSAVLPHGLEQLERDAFYGCTALRHVSIPSTLNHLPDNAFYGCDNLEVVHIPANIHVFGSNVFTRCKSINELWLEGAHIPQTFVAPPNMRVLVMPDASFSENTPGALKVARAAGVVKLAALNNTPHEHIHEQSPTFCAFVREHIVEVVEALAFDAACVRWLVSAQLIAHTTASTLAQQAAGEAHAQACAILLEYASHNHGAHSVLDSLEL